MSLDFKISTVEVNEWLDKLARFRFEVWSANNMIDPSLFPEQKCLEDVDQTAIQIVIELKDELVASTRFASYPDIYSTHHGDYYKNAGIRLEGAVGIPEHTVVRPDMTRRGLHSLIIDEVIRQAIIVGARFTISECTPAAADLLRKRGRQSLGMAPHDPRFPNIQFEWMLTEVPKSTLE